MGKMSELSASVDDAKSITPAEPSAIQLGTLSANTPTALVQQATATAKELRKVVEQTGAVMRISGREYVRCEGWTTLAAMMGVLPREIQSFEHDDRKGVYVSTVGLYRMADGVELTRASAECGGEEEPLWNKRPPYARRSMAQTRATGKACRLAFSWIMQLAGYQPTPAEEMDGVRHEAEQEQPRMEPTYTARNDNRSRKQQEYIPKEEPAEQSDGMRCHFGKNKGMPWSEMSQRQQEWYYSHFKNSGRLSDEDRAAMALLKDLLNAGDDEFGDEVPF